MLAFFVPTGSDHDRNHLAVATWSLIAANVLVWILSNVLNNEQIAKQFGLIAASPQWYQFFTHMFLHAGWPTEPNAPWEAYAMALLHIGFNMVFLWFAGSDLEDVLGRGKFLLVYLGGGLASGILYCLTARLGNFENLQEPAVGASGAISALLGLYAARFPRFKMRIWFAVIIPFPVFMMRQGIGRVNSLLFIGIWIGEQLLFGIQALRAGGGSEVAYWGHIGGFFLGLAYGLVTHQWRHGEQEFLLKEADHLFYKRKWYPAMEVYQKLTQRYPRCAEGYVKLALSWECAGALQRAEKVLRDALCFFAQEGWKEEAAMIQGELKQMVGGKDAASAAAAAEQHAAEAKPKSSSLLFRRKIKSKGQSP